MIARWTRSFLLLALVTGFATAPATAQVDPAAPGSALLALPFSSGGVDYPFVYHLDADNHIIQLRWDGSSWYRLDVTLAATAPAAEPGSALCGFVSDSLYPHVYYLDPNSHAHELAWDGTGWSHRLVTDPSIVPAVSLPAPESDLECFEVEVGGVDKSSLYYLSADNGLHQIQESGASWDHQVLTNVVTNAPAVAPGSALSGYAGDGTMPRIHYFGTDNRINQIAQNSTGWYYMTPTLDANVLPAAPAGFLTSFGVPVGGVEHTRLYYLGPENDVKQLWYGSDWNFSNPTQKAGAAPAAPHSSLTSFTVTISGSEYPRVYYLGADNHVKQLWWSGSTWNLVDLTTATTGGIDAAPGSSIAGFAKSHSSADRPRVYFLSSQNHVFELAFNGSGWDQTDVTGSAQ